MNFQNNDFGPVFVTGFSKKKVQSLNSGSRDFRHTRTSRLQL